MTNRLEGEKISKARLMTAFTKKALEKKAEQLKEDVIRYKRAMGEAIDKGDEYHDNFVYEQASRDFEFAGRQLYNLLDKLSNFIIIEPRKDIFAVDIGNTIIIQFNDETEDEKVTLLGPDDSVQKNEWISFESPLGQSLIGKRAGETASFVVEDNQKQIIGEYNVKIKSILPGNF